MVSTPNSKRPDGLLTSSNSPKSFATMRFPAKSRAAAISRTEHQFTEADTEVQDGTTQTGEAKRHDDHYQYVAAWEHTEPGKPPTLHKEELIFEEVKPSIRSYK